MALDARAVDVSLRDAMPDEYTADADWFGPLEGRTLWVVFKTE